MPPKKSKNGSKADGMKVPELKKFLNSRGMNKTNSNLVVGQFIRSRMTRPEILQLLSTFPAGRELLEKPKATKIINKPKDPFAVFNKPNVPMKQISEQEFRETFGVNGPNDPGFTSMFEDPVRKADITKINIPLRIRKDKKAMEKFIRSKVFSPATLNWRESSRKRRSELMKKPFPRREPLVKFPKPNKNNTGVRIPTRPERPFIAPRKSRGVTKPAPRVDDMTKILERMSIQNNTRQRSMPRRAAPSKLSKLRQRNLFGNSNSNSNSKSNSNSNRNVNMNSNSNSNSNSTSRRRRNMNNTGYMSNMSDSLVNILIKNKNKK